ncbi:MAG: TldD/PmbA family protein [Gaiellaceae bacterium]
MRDACAAAVDAALGAGASYADARAIVRRTQAVGTRDGRVVSLNDAETEGIGVRVLVAGAWGFACDRRLDEAGAREAAARATAFARAVGGRGARALAPLGAQSGVYRSTVELDPFSISLEDKIAHCLRADAALTHPGVIVREASVVARREQQWLVSSDGVSVEQEVVQCGAAVEALASDGRLTQNRSFGNDSAQGGWEVVTGLRLAEQAPRVAEQAAALLQAPPCPAGVTTVVIDADQMELQVHESVGHPTELDRVLGTEAAYAGTSFLKPDDLGSLRYGSELMNVTADPTTPGGLGTFGWDDEGVPAAAQPVVREGVLAGWLGSREVGHAGSMRADGWARMPLVRMTNLHLDPGSGSFEELLDGVGEGVYLETNRSWSIDDKRLSFQFGTQCAWEIRDGRLGRLYRDATYTGITPVFWGSLDAVAGPEEWRMAGVTNCGKGQPGQHAHVSHGASPCRFRDVQVGAAA